MTKKIFANLKNNEQVILFNENSTDFVNIKELFVYDVDSMNKINFLENINSKLRDDEIYFIEINQDNETEYFENINLTIDSIDSNIITGNQYKNVSFLYLIDSQANKLYFKKIYAPQHIEKRKVLGFDLGPTFREESNKITLSPKIDMVYNKTERRIYFKKFSGVKEILKQIINLYRTATEEEISNFFNNDKFGFDIVILGKTTEKLRKRIGVLIDKGFDFNNEDLMNQYEEYDRRYKNKLKKENGKYLINKKSQLENFVELLEERFYDTPITHEKREVDNFRKLNS